MTQNKIQNEKKVAIVTGSARGIGNAIARKLSKEGYVLTLNALTQSNEITSLADEINTSGGEAIVCIGDVSDSAVHDLILSKTIEKWGKIDCLVNNAGVSVMHRGDILDVSEESFDRCVNVNMRGVFFLTQKVVTHMINNNTSQEAFPVSRPSIVFITSANAIAASITRSEYCASKAGVSMIAQNYAIRLATENIDVFEIQPGLIETEMTQPSKHRYEKHIDEGIVASKRWGQPEEIAQTVATLIKGLLPYTVGQVIRNDGGLTTRKF